MGNLKQKNSSESYVESVHGQRIAWGNRMIVKKGGAWDFCNDAESGRRLDGSTPFMSRILTEKRNFAMINEELTDSIQ